MSSYRSDFERPYRPRTDHRDIRTEPRRRRLQDNKVIHSATPSNSRSRVRDLDAKSPTPGYTDRERADRALQEYRTRDSEIDSLQRRNREIMKDDIINHVNETIESIERRWQEKLHTSQKDAQNIVHDYRMKLVNKILETKSNMELTAQSLTSRTNEIEDKVGTNVIELAEVKGSVSVLVEATKRLGALGQAGSLEELVPAVETLRSRVEVAEDAIARAVGPNFIKLQATVEGLDKERAQRDLGVIVEETMDALAPQFDVMSQRVEAEYDERLRLAVALRDMGSDLSSLESKLNKHVATNDGQLEVLRRGQGSVQSIIDNRIHEVKNFSESHRRKLQDLQEEQHERLERRVQEVEREFGTFRPRTERLATELSEVNRRVSGLGSEFMIKLESVSSRQVAFQETALAGEEARTLSVQKLINESVSRAIAHQQHVWTMEMQEMRINEREKDRERPVVSPDDLRRLEDKLLSRLADVAQEGKTLVNDSARKVLRDVISRQPAKTIDPEEVAGLHSSVRDLSGQVQSQHTLIAQLQQNLAVMTAESVRASRFIQLEQAVSEFGSTRMASEAAAKQRIKSLETQLAQLTKELTEKNELERKLKDEERAIKEQERVIKEQEKVARELEKSQELKMSKQRADVLKELLEEHKKLTVQNAQDADRDRSELQAEVERVKVDLQGVVKAGREQVDEVLMRVGGLEERYIISHQQKAEAEAQGEEKYKEVAQKAQQIHSVLTEAVEGHQELYDRTALLERDYNDTKSKLSELLAKSDSNSNNPKNLIKEVKVNSSNTSSSRPDNDTANDELSSSYYRKLSGRVDILAQTQAQGVKLQAELLDRVNHLQTNLGTITQKQIEMTHQIINRNNQTISSSSRPTTPPKKKENVPPQAEKQASKRQHAVIMDMLGEMEERFRTVPTNDHLDALISDVNKHHKAQLETEKSLSALITKVDYTRTQMALLNEGQGNRVVSQDDNKTSGKELNPQSTDSALAASGVSKEQHRKDLNRLNSEVFNVDNSVRELALQQQELRSLINKRTVELKAEIRGERSNNPSGKSVNISQTGTNSSLELRTNDLFAELGELKDELRHVKALNSDSKIAVKSLRSELEEDLDGALSRLRTAENAITETRDHVLSKQDKAFAHIKHVVSGLKTQVSESSGEMKELTTLITSVQKHQATQDNFHNTFGNSLETIDTKFVEFKENIEIKLEEAEGRIDRGVAKVYESISHLPPKYTRVGGGFKTGGGRNEGKGNDVSARSRSASRGRKGSPSPARGNGNRNSNNAGGSVNDKQAQGQKGSTGEGVDIYQGTLETRVRHVEVRMSDLEAVLSDKTNRNEFKDLKTELQRIDLDVLARPSVGDMNRVAGEIKENATRLDSLEQLEVPRWQKFEGLETRLTAIQNRLSENVRDRLEHGLEANKSIRREES